MLNVCYSDVESRRRTRVVGNDVAPGTPLISKGVPAVTITGSGDYDGNAVKLVSAGMEVVIAGGRGGETLRDDEATITFTGTYYFDVEGATASVAEDAVVYITSAGALTLTDTGNTKYGVVEFFRGETSATDTAVTIGENLG